MYDNTNNSIESIFIIIVTTTIIIIIIIVIIIIIIPPALWAKGGLEFAFGSFLTFLYIKGGVYPSLYPSPGTKSGLPGGGRQISFPLLAFFLALHFLTFFCDPLLTTFGSILLHFDLLFGPLFGGFSWILRSSVRHPIFRSVV